MATIGDMVPGTPTGANLVSGGDTQLRDIKSDTQGSFPNFGDTASNTGVCTKTAPELNDAPEKSIAETITGDWIIDADWIFNGTNQTFTTQLRAANGLQSAPSYSFTGFPDAGLLVDGNGCRIAFAGVARIAATTTGAAVTGALDVSTNLTASGFVSVGGQLRIGANTGPSFPDSVVSFQNQLQVFDAAGVSLGFIALSDTQLP